ncbi:hypothetical protein O988_03970 [Pseudogymnoascus sp. VKM F-3808]|nr:hypothetical protein O988_03970 [Pseudogymnoascus sp. VKM F-3808]
MAPRRLLYCGKLESAEKRAADAEKLAHFQITNLIDLSRPRFITQSTQTDNDWGKYVQLGTAVKDGDKGEEVQQPEEPKGKGTSLIRLPKFTKGLGRVVEPHNPSAGSKGKGKATEPSDPPDAEGKGKGNAVKPSEQPDAEGRGKAVEPSEAPDAKGKGKTAEPSDLLDSKSKDKAVQTTALPGIEDKVERVPDNEDRDKVVAQDLKSVTSSRGGSKIGKPGAETKGGSSKAESKLAKELKAENRRLQEALKFLLKGAEERMRNDSHDQMRMPDGECEDKPAEPPVLSDKKGKRKVFEPPGPSDTKGKGPGRPDSKEKSMPVEPPGPPDTKGQSKAAQQPERLDAKGPGKAAEKQKPQQATPEPRNQTANPQKPTPPLSKLTRKRKWQDEEEFDRTFPRAWPDEFFKLKRKDLADQGWGGSAFDIYKYIFRAGAYVYPFWVLTGSEACEPLERYRCLWNSCNRLFTKFFANVFENDKKAQIGISDVIPVIRVFDEFAETGILDRMIRAAVKVMAQLMDPKQQSKFPISNVWDVGDRIESDINHWYHINVIFQGRRYWYKRFYDMLPAEGELPPDELPLPVRVAAGIALPN